MKIGIDAKWYYSGPPSGVRVIQSLVQALLEYDKVNEYVIFLDRKFRHKNIGKMKRDNVTLVYLWAGNNLLSNLFLLPIRAKSFKLDILIFQNFVSPFYRGKKVAYIFDVLFKSFPEFFTPKERLYFFFIKHLTYYAQAVVTLSNEEKKRLVYYKFSQPDKIYPVHIGINNNFKPLKSHDQLMVKKVKEKYQLPDRFLLYVGRLNARKNIELLIKTIPQINDKYIPLVIAGKEDWKHANYKQLAQKVKCLHRISFTGWTEEDELPIIYSLATIFCFPSFAEGFGLPPLEAMASGIPVISSNSTSLPEICGDAAVYVSPQKPSEMILAINSLLEDGSLYRKKIKDGLSHASLFTWEKSAQEFQIIFKKLNTRQI